MRFIKKISFISFTVLSLPKLFCPLYTCIQLSFEGLIWTQELLHKCVQYDCRGECCPGNRTVADSDKDDPGLSFIPILFWTTLANWYCTPLSGLFFLIFLVMTPRWSNFLSSNSLWSCTLSKMMSFIMVQWCLSLVWHCMTLETKILRRRSESTALFFYVCFGLVCGILSYIYVHVNDFRIAKIY